MTRQESEMGMQAPSVGVHIRPESVCLERLSLGLCAVATVSLLAWMFHYSQFGIDFTDESFYLVWMSNPFEFSWSLTQFGFVYHPLYRMLDGDIAALRRVNIGLVFGLAWCLTALVMHSASTGMARNRLSLAVVSAGLSAASLVAFSSWLVTPNYNSLTFQALLIASIGLVLAGTNARPQSLCGWMLIGIGGWLAFMAKPSTAAVLAVAASVYLLATRKLSLKLLSVAIATAALALVLSATIMDGSLRAFVVRLQTGLAFYGYLNAGHDAFASFRLDSFHLLTSEKHVMKVTAMLAFAGGWIALRTGVRWSSLAAAVSLCFFGGIAMLIAGAVDLNIALGTYRGLILFAVALASAGLAVVAWLRGSIGRIQSQQLGMVLLFAVMPYLYAFGTNGNYWWAASFVSFFWLLSGMSALGALAAVKQGWHFALPLSLAAQLMTVLVVLAGMKQPYRQPQALQHNTSTTTIGREGSSLVLSAGYARYLNAIEQARSDSGLPSGTPMIDLTGQSPGVLYAMQAQSLGQAWTVGGYPGSQKLAEASLAKVPCDALSRAWLLVEESGPRRITTAVVESYGAKFATDFALAGSWQTAPGAGGYSESREQKLFKPLAPRTVLDRCRIQRG